jgi:hypothetical protein
MKEEVASVMEGAYASTFLIIDLAKTLLPLGYFIEKPKTPGYFRYGLYAPNDKAWSSIECWDAYLKGEAYYPMETARYLGDFRIGADSNGNPAILWYLEEPTEFGAPNPMHCKVMQHLALELFTDVQTLLRGGPDAQ